MDERDTARLGQLVDDYLALYASRDDRLTALFSDDFSGFTGGGDFLVKEHDAWVAITRQDFAQVKAPLRLERLDTRLQPLSETVALATAFFHIHLPIPDHVLSRETARLVLAFRRESAGWRSVHSSISIPYSLVQEGEVYPLQQLVERNRALEEQIAVRTAELSEANARLQAANTELGQKMAEQREAAALVQQSEALYRSIMNASPDDITITDLQGRVLMASPRAVEMFGAQTVEQAIGRHVGEFLVPEDRARAAEGTARLLSGLKNGPREYKALRIDGTTFDIEVNSDVIPAADGTPSRLIVMVRDISERKVTEAALLTARRDLRTLSGLLPICMHCKKIRDDHGEWSPVEVYVGERTEVGFSHGLCPECLATRYPEFASAPDDG